MGCVSSKLIRKDLEQENGYKNGDCVDHFVSLTSSTYGVLKLDKENQPQNQESQQKREIEECSVDVNKFPPREEDPSEVINAWELMEGLEEEVPGAVQAKKSPRSRLFPRGILEIDTRSPLKFLNQMVSPRMLKNFGGKENKGRGNGGMCSSENSPKTVLKECNNLKGSSRKQSPRLWASIKGSPITKRCDSSFRVDSVAVSSKRSLGPLFDPELVASFEKEVSEEAEQIKKMVSVGSSPASRVDRMSQDSDSILELYKEKCPPGGKNLVILYTTTLRGIRKTFEECNSARSIIESHHIQMFERDISMHSAFKEELRGLMKTKEVKVPLVFVKGRLIGGADEIVKLDKEGKLDILLAGIPMASLGCVGCAGIRFMLCVECNGSCKILGEDGKKSVKCSECNENGLIQCPICC